MTKLSSRKPTKSEVSGQMDDQMDERPIPRDVRVTGVEASKSVEAKRQNGFLSRYLSGANILDIGYRGYINDVDPIVPQAIGVELDYPGYDGRTLPFGDNTQDAVFSSHSLEHIEDFKNALRDWHRVLKVGGFMVIAVPHQFLYEKRTSLPSRWNDDHKRFYTPASLMSEVESALEPNTYRLRHLMDNDADFDYSIPPDRHSGGCYEIEMVLEKIQTPPWKLEIPPSVEIRPNWFQAAMTRVWSCRSVVESVSRCVRNVGTALLEHQKH